MCAEKKYYIDSLFNMKRDINHKFENEIQKYNHEFNQ